MAHQDPDCLLPAQQYHGPCPVFCDIFQLLSVVTIGGSSRVEDQTDLLGFKTERTTDERASADGQSSVCLS